MTPSLTTRETAIAADTDGFVGASSCPFCSFSIGVAERSSVAYSSVVEMFKRVLSTYAVRLSSVDGLVEITPDCTLVTSVCGFALIVAEGCKTGSSSGLFESGSESEETLGTSSFCSDDMSETSRILAVNFLYEQTAAFKSFPEAD